MTKSRLLRKKNEGSYDKNQGCLEKKKVFNLNKVMTKIKVIKKKIKQRCDKNQGSLEKKLSLGVTKIKVTEKN